MASHILTGRAESFARYSEVGPLGKYGNTALSFMTVFYIRFTKVNELVPPVIALSEI